MKIRGTAHHVAEKYLQLARDAQSSGDPVAAESYLQHAEHYFRLIATAQLAQAQAQVGYVRAVGEVDVEDDDDDFSALPDRFASPVDRTPSPPPAPYNDRPPYNGGGERQGYNGERQPQGGGERAYNGNHPYNGNDRPAGGDRSQYDRQERFGGDRQDRPDRGYNQNGGGERFGRDRNNNNNNRNQRPQRDFQQRTEYQQRDMGSAEQPVIREQPREVPAAPPPVQEIRREPPIEARRAEAPQPQPEIRPAPPAPSETGASLPSFITAPTRTVAPPVEAPATAPEPEAAGGDFPAAGGTEFPVRTRRRRRTRAEMEAAAALAAKGDGTD